MGNYRFRLSDMMPNSWFYKLKDMRRPTTTTNTQHTSSSKRNHHHHHQNTTPLNSQSNQQSYIPNRPSYYIPSNNTTSPAHPKASDTHFPIDPQRKTKKKTTQKRPTKPPSSKPLSSVSRPDHLGISLTATTTDIIIDMKDYAHRLPPILTTPEKKDTEINKAELMHKQHNKQVMPRRAQHGLRRIKVRPSSPKIEIKKVQASRNKRMASSNGLAESFVVVKRSADPRRDFKESMVEMIVENDLRGYRDLEELLACYLSLNSDEYHGLIVKVFEEIWIDLTEVRV